MFQQQIIKWNNQFPFDRWWRKKYTTSFNSTQHREQDQIDIFFEFVEDSMFKDLVNDHLDNEDNKQLYNKGIWQKERKGVKNEQQEENVLFKKLLNNLNLNKQSG